MRINSKWEKQQALLDSSVEVNLIHPRLLTRGSWTLIGETIKVKGLFRPT